VKYTDVTLPQTPYLCTNYATYFMDSLVPSVHSVPCSFYSLLRRLCLWHSTRSRVFTRNMHWTENIDGSGVPAGIPWARK